MAHCSVPLSTAQLKCVLLGGFTFTVHDDEQSNYMSEVYNITLKFHFRVIAYTKIWMGGRAYVQHQTSKLKHSCTRC